MKRKLGVILILLLISTYVGLYLNKKYQFHGIWDYPVEVNDDYILHNFFKVEGKVPESELEIKRFIANNDTLFTGNLMAEYLLEHDFLMKYDEITKQYFIYDIGFNYKNDNLKTRTVLPDVNLFNYLFSDGDILIFSSKEIDKRRITIDTDATLPPNISIELVK